MKQHGGKREGAGRKPGSTGTKSLTKPMRVSIELTKQQVDALPSLLKLFENWDADCKANPGNPRHDNLAKAVEDIKKLGYLE